MKERIGARVRELRKLAGFSSAEVLAERLKVSNTAVYSLERGESWLSAEMLIGLCAVFRCRPQDIFTEVGAPLERPAKLVLLEEIASLKDDHAELLLPALMEQLSALRGEKGSLEPQEEADQPAQKKDQG